MITRDALDKIKAKLLADGYYDDAPGEYTYEYGFDAAVSLLWPVIEACGKVSMNREFYNPDFIPSVRDLIDAEEQFNKALSELKEKLK